MTTINILIVEDKDQTIESWKSAIALSNAADSGGFKFYAEYSKSINDTLLKLNSFEFDTAVIDLRLEEEGVGSNNENSDGNKVLEQIISSKICLVAIYSGQVIDVDLSEEQEKYIKVFEKGGVNPPAILKWINEQSRLVSTISNLKVQLNSSMSELFYKSIWPRWEHWLESSDDGDFTVNALKRHMSTHLHATFVNESNAHPEEYYFIPSLNATLDTGDIILVDDKHYIHVTPRCEIAANKHETLQFVELSDVSTDFNKFSSILADESEISGTEEEKAAALEVRNTSKNKAKSKLSNIIKNGGNKASLHFLPRIKKSNGEEFGPFHAKFDRLIFVLKTDTDEIQRYQSGVYASLSNEFLPSLVERLGSHFSRIGTPDYSHQ